MQSTIEMSSRLTTNRSSSNGGRNSKGDWRSLRIYAIRRSCIIINHKINENTSINESPPPKEEKKLQTHTQGFEYRN